MKKIFLIAIFCVFVAACSKDEGGTSQQSAAPAAPASSAAPAAAPASSEAAAPAPAAAAMSDGGTVYVDHTKDEMEFQLKKSLAGLESLLEDVSDSEQVEMIKKDIADLQAKLSNL